jgi:hypothetical protein
MLLSLPCKPTTATLKYFNVKKLETLGMPTRANRTNEVIAVVVEQHDNHQVTIV